jgi:hypothetical protein
MATENRATSTYPIDATEVTSFRATYVNPLRNAFVSGGRIRAADVNLLRTAISVFNGHTHGVIDYASIGNFGNNGPRTVIAANPRVSTIVVGQTTPAEVAAATLIKATDVNAHVASVNNYINHVHVIFDNPTHP